MKDPYIIIKWHVSDIDHAAPYLTHEEQVNVLQYVYKNHDPEYGINWQVIEDAIETLKHEAIKKLEAKQCKK